MENSQGNCENPPSSRTTDGTAVARMVESMATSAVASITESRIGPRSLRRPIVDRSILGALVWLTSGGNRGWSPVVPPRVNGVSQVDQYLAQEDPLAGVVVGEVGLVRRV